MPKRFIGTALAVLLLLLPFSIAVSARGEALGLKSAGWAYKEVHWAAPGDAGAYDFFWTVKDARGETVEVGPANGLWAFEDPAGGSLVLIAQPAAAQNYGYYTVTLTVNGAESEPVEFWLLDDGDFRAALNKAKAVAQNPNNRYTDKSTTQAAALVREAEAVFAQGGDMDPGGLEEWTLALSKCAAEAEYRLALGWPFLNRALNKTARHFWEAYDFITVPFRWAEKLVELLLAKK
ncbi:MAG: hypothetical protein FWH26_02485 [Oscillospiraceae bacterium]|nr:hypothetical protein [Oscillospiraceae bacterium]